MEHLGWIRFDPRQSRPRPVHLAHRRRTRLLLEVRLRGKKAQEARGAAWAAAPSPVCEKLLQPIGR